MPENPDVYRVRIHKSHAPILLHFFSDLHNLVAMTEDEREAVEKLKDTLERTISTAEAKEIVAYFRSIRKS